MSNIFQDALEGEDEVQVQYRFTCTIVLPMTALGDECLGEAVDMLRTVGSVEVEEVEELGIGNPSRLDVAP